MLYQTCCISPFGNWVRVKINKPASAIATDRCQPIEYDVPSSYILMPYPYGWTLLPDILVDKLFTEIDNKEALLKGFYVKGNMESIKLDTGRCQLSYIVPKEGVVLSSFKAADLSPKRLTLPSGSYVINNLKYKENMGQDVSDDYDIVLTLQDGTDEEKSYPWIVSKRTFNRLFQPSNYTSNYKYEWHLLDDLTFLSYYGDAYLALLELDQYYYGQTGIGESVTEYMPYLLNCPTIIDKQTISKEVIRNFVDKLYTDGVNSQLFFDRFYAVLGLLRLEYDFDEINNILAIDFRTTKWSEFRHLSEQLIYKLRNCGERTIALYLNLQLVSFFTRRNSPSKDTIIAVCERRRR